MPFCTLKFDIWRVTTVKSVRVSPLGLPDLVDHSHPLDLEDPEIKSYFKLSEYWFPAEIKMSVMVFWAVIPHSLIGSCQCSYGNVCKHICLNSITTKKTMLTSLTIRTIQDQNTYKLHRLDLHETRKFKNNL